MRRNKLFTVRTEQDIEAACRRMDEREGGMPDDFGDDLAEGEHEQDARWAPERSGGLDDAW